MTNRRVARNWGSPHENSISVDYILKGVWLVSVSSSMFRGPSAGNVRPCDMNPQHSICPVQQQVSCFYHSLRYRLSQSHLPP